MTSLFENYTLEPGTYDELNLGGSSIQPHWQGLIDYLNQQDGREQERVQHDISRLLRENGVTYNFHGDAEDSTRAWRLDPVPLIISAKDWQVIERGMEQRARLLNLILEDIYGEQRLLKEQLLPWELIYSHSGFLRPVTGIKPVSPPLTVYAADLGRGPDQQMWVLGDRTQAPSGAGYALENRMVMSQVMSTMFKDGQIRRLSNFFRHLQNTLYDLASQRVDSPQVAVLTPGPFNETYFEHAYLANYLGFLLVQGHDLTIRDGQLWLKTIEGLQPVDVLLRRVDDAFCDPLELLDYSQLGVTGLVESVRRQNVSIANALGSGVLENPGLMPFMSTLSKQLLSEELILPSAATWWCGQPKELTYVIDNLESLVIKNISRTAGSRTFFGHKLSSSEKEALQERIKANPAHFVGQEQVSFSTVPTLVDGSFEARHTILRSFAVARRDGTSQAEAEVSYEVMPGGLTRSAGKPNTFVVTSHSGGISRDTWVLSSESEHHKTLWVHSNRLIQSFKQSFTISSREAENLFWVGRYAERAEATARLVRMILELYFHVLPAHDEEEIIAFEAMLRGLTHVTMTYPGFVGDESTTPEELKEIYTQPEDEILSVILDPERPGSLAYNLKGMVNAAYGVRNQWSVDVWPVIDGIDAVWSHLSKNREELNFQAILEEVNVLIMRLRSFSGYLNESMTQGFDWLLLDIGVRIERGQRFISLMRSLLLSQFSEEVESLILENLLITTDNIITYRRRYRSYLHMHTVLEQLLLDSAAPRSLIYQLETLQTNIKSLPREQVGFRLSTEERLILDAITRLRLTDISSIIQIIGEDGDRLQLDSLLAQLSDHLNEISLTISKFYFTHAEVQRPLMSLPPDIDDGI